MATTFSFSSISPADFTLFTFTLDIYLTINCC
jgi:hypothetical protein